MVEAAAGAADGGAAAYAAARAMVAEAEARERRVMEREVSAAYLALLIGFVCKGGDPSLAATALCEMGQPSFARVGALLRGFLELHASANLISRESAQTMAAIVKWLEER